MNYISSRNQSCDNRQKTNKNNTQALVRKYDFKVEQKTIDRPLYKSLKQEKSCKYRLKPRYQHINMETI